ncbi:Nif3-like dinuclear metal center hexameric protein, partial [Myxococcota bacterium]|nr:Nif3-like dinuclear metal center hexameric protein [Myxococcota bacterium]
AVLEGCDTFITGEMSGPAQYTCTEEGINYFALGHESSERFGVEALGEYLHEHHGFDTRLFLYSYEA